MRIEKNYEVEYAHRLPNHSRGCKFVHGHTGRIRVVFDGQISPDDGMVYDFGHFGWLIDIVNRYDHALVLMQGDPLLDWLLKGIEEEKIPPLDLVQMPVVPTAENLAYEIYQLIVRDAGFRKSGLSVVSVSFEETPGNVATYLR